MPAIEEPIIKEVKKIDDLLNAKIDTEIKPAILIAKVPEESKKDKNDDSSSEEKKDDSSSLEIDEVNDKLEKIVESPIDLFKDFFSSDLIHGEPQLQKLPIDTKDSDAYLTNNNNNENKEINAGDDIVSIEIVQLCVNFT